MTDIYYQDTKGEWRWRLKAANGRILADSGEGYKNVSDCLEDIDRVKNSANAEVKKESCPLPTAHRPLPTDSGRRAGEEGITRRQFEWTRRAGLRPARSFLPKTPQSSLTPRS